MRRIITVLFIMALYCNTSSGQPNLNQDYILTRAKQFQEQRDFAASSKLLDRLIDNRPEKPTHEDSLKLVEILSMQGENFYNLRITSQAAELYEQALRIADATGDTKKIAKLCNELFILYMNSNDISMSKNLLERSLNAYKTLGDKIGECKLLNNIGIFYYKQNDIDQSLYYYKESLKLAGNDSAIRSTILTNIAESYNKAGDPKYADKYLEEALKLQNYRFDTPSLLQSWLNKAGVQADLGNIDNAHRILNQLGKRISQIDPDRIIDAYTQMALLYLQLGDSVTGLRWGLKAQELADSLHTNEENSQLREMLVRYNSERIEEHNKTLELDIKRQKQLNYAMTVIIIFAIGTAIYLIHRIRTDRKKNQLIREQREQLHEFERLEHDRKEKDYQEKLDQKNRQLTAYSLDATSISEMHKSVTDILKNIRKEVEKPLRTEINSVITRIQNYNKKEVNEEFKLFFNEVHPDYIKRLSAQFPELTQNELRLCTYLYLGMTTKEIAAITFRETRSIESSRLRLRKKLGLTSETTLHDFLNRI